MLFKLSINNVKKSYRDFMLYFITLTFSVCLFYVFNSLDAQKAMMVLTTSSAEMLKTLANLINMVSVFVSFVLGFLIVYANNFLIKRRKKELGLYMILGMSKAKMSRILIVETLIIGFFSLLVGLIIGIFSSQWLSVFTAKLFEADMTHYVFIFSIAAFYKTLLYFGLIFIIVMLLSTISITRYKLIDLINATRQNEKPRIKNPVITLILFITSIICLGLAYIFVLKNGISVFDKKLLAEVILGAIGTFLFFASLSGFFLQLIQRNKKNYYSGLNTFILRQINSKINTAHISISFVCLMLFFTIGILATGLGMNSVMSSFTKHSTPYDATFTSFSSKSVTDTLIEDGFNLNNYAKESYEYSNYTDKSLTFNAVFGQVKEYFPKDMGNSDSLLATPLTFVKLSDYNKLMEMQNKPKITLDRDSVALFSDYADSASSLKVVLDKFIEKKYPVVIDNQQYSVYSSLQTIGISTSMGNSVLTLIAPDSLVERLPISIAFTTLNLNCKADSKLMQEKLLNDVINANQNKLHLKLSTREEIKSMNAGTKAIISFIGIYLGLIFLITSAAVLALQQLSEVSDNRHRYNILKKIGADEKQINRAILKQIAIYFSLPLILACVHSVVGLYVANKAILSMGDTNATANIILTAVMILFIYGGYFYATYIGSKNIVLKNTI